MTQNLFLVTKTLEPGQEYINGITAVLINLASTDTTAQVLAAAVAAANGSELYVASSGSGVGNAEIGGTADTRPIPPHLPYFDTVLNVGTGPGSGNLFTNKDAYVFKTFGAVFIAGTAY